MSLKTAKEVLVISKSGARNGISLDYGKLRKTLLTLRAISHPLRKKIIGFIENRKRVTVTEIYEKFKLEQSVASQHLAILRRAGIVSTQRNGKFIYYTIDKLRVAEVTKLVEDLPQNG